MRDWINQNPSAIVVLSLLCFGLFWILTINLIALASGWKLLAQRFRGPAEFPGARWSWQSAQMRFGLNYNNCLIVGADQAGLFIGAMAFSRFGHPPLSIPWVEITAQPGRVFLIPVVELRLGRAEQIPFKIRPVLAERLAAAAGPGWPVSPGQSE